jgi:hypothetical protein
MMIDGIAGRRPSALSPSDVLLILLLRLPVDPHKSQTLQRTMMACFSPMLTIGPSLDRLGSSLSWIKIRFLTADDADALAAATAAAVPPPVVADFCGYKARATVKR